MPHIFKHVGYDHIVSLIKPNSTVLDLGCGQGDLLKILFTQKNVQGTGIELSEENILKCVKKGIPVIQGDIDEGLKEFKKHSYDYVILSHTLQVVRKQDFVLKEMARVGKHCIISFPNFAYWRIRFYLMFKGMMPKSKILPYEWYNTPNIHLSTIKDVVKLCHDNDIKIKKTIYLSRKKNSLKRRPNSLSNFFAEECIMVLQKP